MKKLFTILSVTILTVSIFAQAPERMTYQAVVRDADGQLLTNTQVGIKVSIQKYIFGIPPMPPSFEDVYVETHSIYSTNENGLLTVIIGAGQIESGDFANINWGDGLYYINTAIDPGGGTNYTIEGKSPLLSVPYALHAQNVKTYQVGDFALGGIVFYVEPCGTKGLVAAKEDQSTGVRWYAGTNGRTQAKGDGPYAGKTNTSIIIAALVAIGDDNATYAARICNELKVTEGGKTYGDWYLPSKEELSLMYQNKSVIDATAVANGGSAFAGENYWSSNELEHPIVVDRAWYQNFATGSQQNHVKSNTYRIRAVRAF